MTEHRIRLEDVPTNRNGHSIFGASGAKRWMSCSGSLVANALASDNAGIEAATGTVAHAVGELWLNTGTRPDHLIGDIEAVKNGEQTFEIEIDEEMLAFVEQYVDWCVGLPGEHYVETHVDFSDLTPVPNQGGTSDHTACTMGHAIISDLKYGIGIKVFAENNPQLLLYAYGVFREFDWLYNFERFTLRIAQPRLKHFDEWDVSREELLRFAEYARQRAHAAWCIDAPRAPGAEQCQFCKIKLDCSAFAVWVERLSGDVFVDLDAEVPPEAMEDIQQRLGGGDYKLSPAPLHVLTLEHKVAIYKSKQAIQTWLDNIGNDLYRRLADGDDVPGFKLVDGSNTRSFSNPMRAVEALQDYGLDEDVVRPRVMISPAEAERALTKIGFKRKTIPSLIDPLISKTPGKAVMVPSKDSRTPIRQLADDTFENLDDDDGEL